MIGVESPKTEKNRKKLPASVFESGIPRVSARYLPHPLAHHDYGPKNGRGTGAASCR
jgi:hypothetical protein